MTKSQSLDVKKKGRIYRNNKIISYVISRNKIKKAGLNQIQKVGTKQM